MQRPLFDPSKIAGPAKRAKAASDASVPPSQHVETEDGGQGSISGQTQVASGEDAPLSVSQLSARIDTALKRGFPAAVRVVGELTGFRDRTHWYFDIKDEDAVINCVMFASAARKVRGVSANGGGPQQGTRVLLTGRIDFYAKAGKVTLIVEKMELVGAGALEAALRQLVEEVRALGWLDAERKRALPVMPRRVAVITSRTGAALQDVLVTMKRRCPGVDVVVVDVRVQGDAAVPEIVEALQLVSDQAVSRGIDAILLTRGGGSMEDLWCFNHREVAQAIVESSIPVVAAIGHETDVTLAELVADERCATPTQAAMRLTPDRDALLRQVASMGERLRLLMQRSIREKSLTLESACDAPMFAEPAAWIASFHENIDDLHDELLAATQSRIAVAREHLATIAMQVERTKPGAVLASMRERVASHEQRLRRATHSLREIAARRLESAERELNAVGPIQVLARGYSVTLNEAGSLVRKVADAKPGSHLRTRVADGVLTSTVDGSEPEKPRKPKEKPGKQDSPGLFGM